MDIKSHKTYYILSCYNNSGHAFYQLLKIATVQYEYLLKSIQIQINYNNIKNDLQRDNNLIIQLSNQITIIK